MAAALFRGGFCVRCIHRELCRVVWRPQTAALFSSKSSDRKQPRRTHIKKAKPQPAVDVTKLLEQLFSQQRPGAAPPAGKARPSKPATTSKTERVASVFPAASSLKQAPAPPSSRSSATSSTSASPSDGIEPKTSAETVETKVETAAVLPSSAHMVETNVETSSVPAAAVETAIESPVEPVPPPVETLEASVEPTVETKDTDSGVFVSHAAKEEPLIETIEPAVEAAVVVEGPVEPTIDVTLDATAQKVETKHGIPHSATVEPPVETSTTKESRSAAVESTVDAQAVETNTVDMPTSKVEPLIETIEPAVETSHFPFETLEATAAVPVESTIDITVDATAQIVETKSADLHAAKVEPLIETTIEPAVETSHFPLETLETGAAVVEHAVEPTIDITVDATAQKVEPLIETTIEARHFELETPGSRAAVAEGSVETTIEAEAAAAAHKVETNSTDSGPVNLLHTSKVESLIETTIESPIEARETLETVAAVVEDPVDITVEAAAQKIETISTDSGPVNLSLTAKEEALIETVEPAVEGLIEPSVETEAAAELSQQAAASLKIDSMAEDLSSVNVPLDDVKMTLESMTLHVDSVLVASLRTDELLQTKSVLEERAEKQLQQMLEVKAAAEGESSSEDEGESLTDVLSKWDSLSEDLQQLEGQSGAMVTELLFHVPAAVVSKPPDGEQEAEAMTLESITLSNVAAAVEGLETEVLQEARNALEKEADVLVVKEEKMDVTPTQEDVCEEAEIFTLDSISEATDAIEAETAVMMEAMFGSEQGPRQPISEQKLEEVTHEVETESRDEEVKVLEAMSLESVTLAEVEASLGALESLSETSEYLEREAGIVAGEEKVVEVEVEPKETSEALKMEALSLPEGDEDLQIDALMEELLFSVPGHVTRGTGGQAGQEVVRAESLDATVATGSVDVDPAAAVTDDLQASPVLEEVLQGQEEVEGAQTEASGTGDGSGTQTALDPVQRLFLEKIREYNNKRRLNGGLMEAEPEFEKRLSEETAKLQRLYGGGDLSSFPQFTFTEPEMDQDSK